MKTPTLSRILAAVLRRCMFSAPLFDVQRLHAGPAGRGAHVPDGALGFGHAGGHFGAGPRRDGLGSFTGERMGLDLLELLVHWEGVLDGTASGRRQHTDASAVSFAGRAAGCPAAAHHG